MMTDRYMRKVLFPLIAKAKKAGVDVRAHDAMVGWVRNHRNGEISGEYGMVNTAPASLEVSWGDIVEASGVKT